MKTLPGYISIRVYKNIYNINRFSATKYSGCKRAGDPNAGGNSRMCLAQSLDASLKRMGTGHVDLLYVHMWNFRTPVEEVMRSLDDAVRCGKVHYIAVSDTPAWKIAQANTIATLRGWSPFIGLQTQYSLVEPGCGSFI